MTTTQLFFLGLIGTFGVWWEILVWPLNFFFVQRWWNVDELLQTLTRTPSLFTGVHYPVLLKAAKDLQMGRIKVSDAEQYRMLTYNSHRQDGLFSDLKGNASYLLTA